MCKSFCASLSSKSPPKGLTRAHEKATWKCRAAPPIIVNNIHTNGFLARPTAQPSFSFLWTTLWNSCSIASFCLPPFLWLYRVNQSSQFSCLSGVHWQDPNNLVQRSAMMREESVPLLMPRMSNKLFPDLAFLSSLLPVDWTAAPMVWAPMAGATLPSLSRSRAFRGSVSSSDCCHGIEIKADLACLGACLSL